MGHGVGPHPWLSPYHTLAALWLLGRSLGQPEQGCLRPVSQALLWTASGSMKLEPFLVPNSFARLRRKPRWGKEFAGPGENWGPLEALLGHE